MPRLFRTPMAGRLARLRNRRRRRLDGARHAQEHSRRAAHVRGDEQRRGSWTSVEPRLRAAVDLSPDKAWANYAAARLCLGAWRLTGNRRAYEWGVELANAAREANRFIDTSGFAGPSSTTPPFSPPDRRCDGRWRGAGRRESNDLGQRGRPEGRGVFAAQTPRQNRLGCSRSTFSDRAEELGVVAGRGLGRRPAPGHHLHWANDAGRPSAPYQGTHAVVPRWHRTSRTPIPRQRRREVRGLRYFRDVVVRTLQSTPVTEPLDFARRWPDRPRPCGGRAVSKPPRCRIGSRSLGRAASFPALAKRNPPVGVERPGVSRQPGRVVSAGRARQLVQLHPSAVFGERYQVYLSSPTMTYEPCTYTGDGRPAICAPIGWIQPQATAGFGPPGSLVVAGFAPEALAGAPVFMHWRNATRGSAWTMVACAPALDGQAPGTTPFRTPKTQRAVRGLRHRGNGHVRQMHLRGRRVRNLCM